MGVVMDEGRRLRYLAAMGIQVWQPRVAGEPEQALAQPPDLNAKPPFDQRQDRKPRPTQTHPATATGASGAQAALQHPQRSRLLSMPRRSHRQPSAPPTLNARSPA